MRIVTAEEWYATAGVGDGVTHVYERHIKPFYRCNCWLIRGRGRDVLIDSGTGLISLPRHVPLVAERPVLAVAGHTHFDHIGSHHEFPERAVHPAEAEILADPTRATTLADPYATPEMFTALPPGGFDPAHYAISPAPATRLLEGGDAIDLGDRRFEVVHTPGPSPGGIAFWEAATGIMFAADAVYDGPLIDDCYHSNVDDYVRMMERLLAYPVRVVHAGHFASFGRERYRELIRGYLDGKGRRGA